MSDEWGICDLLGMPHKKDGSTAGYVQPCVNWRPLVPAPKPEASAVPAKTETVRCCFWCANAHTMGLECTCACHKHEQLIDSLKAINADVEWTIPQLGAIRKLLAAKDAEIARFTQERDAAVAAAFRATVQACADEATRHASVANRESDRSAFTYIAEKIRGISEQRAKSSDAALELERVRAAIAELQASPSVGTSGAGTSLLQELLNVNAYRMNRLAELQRREKELAKR
jgi:hypothetical protein